MSSVEEYKRDPRVHSIPTSPIMETIDNDGNHYQ